MSAAFGPTEPPWWGTVAYLRERRIRDVRGFVRRSRRGDYLEAVVSCDLGGTGRSYVAPTAFPAARRGEAVVWLDGHMARLREPHIALALSAEDPSVAHTVLAPLAGLMQEVTLAVQEQSGVYFLLQGEALVYIGQSQHVIRRVAHHKADKHFDRALFVAVRPEGLDSLEWALIAFLRPPLNSDVKPLNDERRRLLWHLGFGRGIGEAPLGPSFVGNQTETGGSAFR